MSPRWWLCLGLAFASSGMCQSITRQNVASILGFENNVRAGFYPVGWGGSADSIFVDDQVIHGGRYSVRIQRDSASSGSFSTVMVSLPIDFTGKTIEWRGFVKTQALAGAAALWMREDSSSGMVAFASTEGLNVTGDTDWKEYSISVPITSAGRTLSVGFLTTGPGKAWADDLQILVDGQPIANAPARTSPLDTDHQFDNGSGVALSHLSDTQIQNLTKLAKVWGFLKYHHPSVTAGEHHWDYDLFRVLPQVLSAPDNAAANAVILSWATGFGAVTQCTACAALNTADLYLSPSLDWISDEAALGSSLSQFLRDVYKNRSPDSQFFVSLATSASNPSFENEPPYPNVRLPDSGYQILALFRFWNMVQYFYPNRDIMGGDPAHAQQYWDEVLQSSIPRIALASDAVSYQQELMRFITAINDTHANLWSSITVRPPMGQCGLPVEIRFIEGLPVVNRYLSESYGRASGLLRGDVIEELDSVPIGDLVQQLRPFYADSNEAARLRDIGRYLTRGTCASTSVKVRRAGLDVSVSTARVPVDLLNLNVLSTHDRDGDTFQRLSEDVAYLKLSSVVAANSASYVRQAAGTKGLVIDIRNYPSEFVVYTLGSLLVSNSTPFVRFTKGDASNPGAFHWMAPITLTPAQPHYSGKVVILVDEITQSQAEFTTMAFRTAPGAIVIGSTTAGADGDVSLIPLPGGLSSYISGIGVFYPDNRPTQRVGIIPDIEVKPTVLGIQSGRDELLDEAVRQITGAGSDRPVISLVANAESEAPTIAPNTWVMIKGTNLAPAGHTRIWTGSDIQNGNMPAQLDGVSVTVNGVSAYIYYISPTQINILTPADMAAGPARIVVSNNGAVSAPFSVAAEAISPSLFIVGGKYALAQHLDWSLLGPASLSVPGYPFTEAKPGETIVLYGNGFGPTSAKVVIGSATQSGTLTSRPEVTIGGVAAGVDAALISPGLYQLNVTVPAGLPDGDHPIVATYQGKTTQDGLLLSVKR